MNAMTKLALVATLIGCLPSPGLSAQPSGLATWYVAPAASGNGGGSSPANAAFYLDSGVLTEIRTALAAAPARVVFLDGTYDQGSLTLVDWGDEENRLLLEGATADGAVFYVETGTRSGLHLRRSRNIAVRRIHFTGPGDMPYAMIVRSWSPTGPETRDILVEDCSFVDLPNVTLGATGVAYPNAHHVTYRRCTFVRVGPDAHAHMMYHTGGAHHIHVIDCHFEDCAGDYVRFRDLTDLGVVKGCTFRSTSTWPPANPVSCVFVSMPLFCDVNPGDEYFPTRFLIAESSFTYLEPFAPWNRKAIAFHHYGYDPPNRNHLLTAAEGAILAAGAPSQKRDLLWRNCAIDLERVRVVANAYSGTELDAAYGCYALYGATSAGWEGFGPIADAVSASPLAAIHVDRNATGAEDGTSWADAYTRIQQGLDAALAGAVIRVAPGRYRENLQFDGRDVLLRSAEPASWWAVRGTVIDGGGVGPAVRFSGEETEACRLLGFTIENGLAEDGGGISAASATPTISGCLIRGNRALRAGGGIHLADSGRPGSTAVVTSCILVDNAAALGGGVCLEGGSGTAHLTNLSFSDNAAEAAGGAICAASGARVDAANLVLWGDSAGVGDEIWIGDPRDPSTLSIASSDVEGGLAGVRVEPGCTLSWGAGMIDADPLFVDPAGGDLHLSPHSPCIDAGDNGVSHLSEEDLDGEPRILPRGWLSGFPPPAAVVDMGADEQSRVSRVRW